MAKKHETMGSDILAISRALTLTEHVLGKELAAKVALVKSAEWYPIDLLLESLRLVESRGGPLVLRQVGRRLFEISHAEQAKLHVKSAADLIFSLDEMYHRLNRGDESGGWRVRSFQPGRALIEKRTPHPCPLEEGILTQAFASCGFPVLVTQIECTRKGAPRCIFELTSVLRDERWHGGRAPIAEAPPLNRSAAPTGNSR